jgi:hypothetical protein
MTTEKQTAANRRNAKLSTGPKTEEGRKTSSLNSYKHGITGQTEIMTPEQANAHDAFVNAIIDDLLPVGALERQLANSISESHWRMNRVVALENNLIANSDFTLRPDNSDVDYDPLTRALGGAQAFLDQPQRLHLLTIYEMRIHRKAQSDLKQLRELQSARRAAAEKEQAATEFSRSQAFEEAAAIVEHAASKGEPCDPGAVFTHPNGFVFSHALLADSAAWERRLREANIGRGGASAVQAAPFGLPLPLDPENVM